MVDIAQITQQAQQMSAINGQSPEQNAYSILRNAYGMTNAQMDSLWGFAPGSVDSVFGRQDGAGVGIAGSAPVQSAPAFDSSGMRPIYEQKTVDARGAPRQVDDTSKLLGYTKDNGNGTYTEFSPTGEVRRTYEAKTGFANGLNQTLDSIGSDKSGLLSDFVVPAALMYAGSQFVGGTNIPAANPMAIDPATAAAVNGTAGGTIATAGTGTVAATTAAKTAAEIEAAKKMTETGLLTTANKYAPLIGATVGALGSKDTSTTTSADKSPWAPAQPWMLANLGFGQQLQQNYQRNPFSQFQKSAYNNSVGLGNAFRNNTNSMVTQMNAWKPYQRTPQSQTVTPLQFQQPNLGLTQNLGFA